MTVIETTPRVVRVGDFFEESWGYDQTNVTFYQVVAISASGKTVKLRRVNATVVEAREYTGLLAPVRDGFRDDLDGMGNARAGLLTRRLRMSSYSGWAVNMPSYSDAYLWDGKPCSQTGAQYGH
jgi:hypothetical protein